MTAASPRDRCCDRFTQNVDPGQIEEALSTQRWGGDRPISADRWTKKVSGGFERLSGRAVCFTCPTSELQSKVWWSIKEPEEKRGGDVSTVDLFPRPAAFLEGLWLIKILVQMPQIVAICGGFLWLFRFLKLTEVQASMCSPAAWPELLLLPSTSSGVPGPELLNWSHCSVLSQKLLDFFSRWSFIYLLQTFVFDIKQPFGCPVSCLELGCNPRPQRGHWRSNKSQDRKEHHRIIAECLRCFVFCVQLHGTLRVVMEPLLGDMPLVGALSVFFLKKPVSTLTFDPCPLHPDQNDCFLIIQRIYGAQNQIPH